MSIFPVPDYAYLDPGTGSMILSIVIAGIAGALVSIKIYWAKVSTWVKSIFQKQQAH